VKGLGFTIKDLRFVVRILEFGVWGLAFGVWSLMLERWCNGVLVMMRIPMRVGDIAQRQRGVTCIHPGYRRFLYQYSYEGLGFRV
jgi:hypothetical protein